MDEPPAAATAMKTAAMTAPAPALAGIDPPPPTELSDRDSKRQAFDENWEELGEHAVVDEPPAAADIGDDDDDEIAD